MRYETMKKIVISVCTMLLICFSADCIIANSANDELYSKELNKVIKGAVKKYMKSLLIKDRDIAVSSLNNIIKNNPDEAGVCYMYLAEMYGVNLTENKENHETYFNYLKNAESYLSQVDKFNDLKYYVKYNIGLCYYNAYYVDKDYVKAKSYFEEAVTHNKQYGLALAVIYQYGYGVDVDYKKAIILYRDALIAGNQSVSWINLYDFIYMVDQMYLNSFNKDAFDYYIKACQVLDYGKECINYLKKSAEMGYAPAMSVLGSYFYSQPNSEITKEIAENWIRKAAEQEFVPAICNLGVLITKKIENLSKKDTNYSKYFNEGKDLLLKSADAGMPYAQYTIGEWHYFGVEDYVKIDLREACYYFSLAAKGYNESAIDMSNTLRRQMNKGAIIKIDERLANNPQSDAMQKLNNAIAKYEELLNR